MSSSVELCPGGKKVQYDDIFFVGVKQHPFSYYNNPCEIDWENFYLFKLNDISDISL